MNVNGKKRKLKTESWGISIVKEKVWVIKKKKKKSTWKTEKKEQEI